MTKKTTHTAAISKDTFPVEGYARVKQVAAFTTLSEQTIYRKAKDNKFPRPYKLSDNCTAWKAEEVRQWLANREWAV